MYLNLFNDMVQGRADVLYMYGRGDAGWIPIQRGADTLCYLDAGIQHILQQ